MSRQHKGFLINLEGGEGCGKTSHMPFLVNDLRSRGLNVFPAREPGGTSIGEQIREILHNHKNIGMNSRTETLLYQAARAQIVDESLKPRLEDGEIVILDRFFDSTIAYQGYGHRQGIERIRELINYATDGLRPDLTVLLDVDVEIGLSRKGKSNEWNRMDALPKEFHERVRAGYLLMAKNYPNWIVIDANKEIEVVRDKLITEIVGKLEFVGLVEG